MLGRNLAGECNDLEAARVRRWLAEDSATAQMVESLEEAARNVAATRTAHAVDVEAALGTVRARIRETRTAEPRPLRATAHRASPDRRRQARAAVTWLRAAAAVVLFAAGAWLWQRVQTDAPAVAIAPHRHVTSVGQVDTLSLPDGTEVVLAPGSRLDVPAGYGDVARTVELNGVAFFRVLHDEARPFTVHITGRAVRDLGTEFTVRASPDGSVEVVVTEGEVMILNEITATEGPSLRAGDRGTISAEGALLVSQGGARPDDLAWTAGRLVFDDAPLATVADDLRRWYGIELGWTDSATADLRITASFDSEPVDEVLAVIGSALGATIQLDDNRATIHFPATAP